MSKKSKKRLKDVFTLYVDGSFYETDQRAGVGGIIIPPHSIKNMLCFRNRLKGHQNSFTAEINAVTTGLGKVPPKSNILVYSDHASICQRINEGAETIALTKEFEKTIAHAALKKLKTAIEKHNSVMAKWISDKNSPLLLSAHYLAQSGAYEDIVDLDHALNLKRVHSKKMRSRVQKQIPSPNS